MRRCWLLLLLCWLLPVQADVLLTVSQPQMTAGSTLELLVETRSSRAEPPELVWLESWNSHFELLEQTHQVQQATRGDYLHRWLLLLQHRQPNSISRRLSLPPLRLGEQSSPPFEILIEAARGGASGSTAPALRQPLEMQHRVDFAEAYVGQTLVYELLIRYQGFPVEPRLSQLDITGGTARELGDGREQGFSQRGARWQEARWQQLIQLHATEAGIGPRYFSSRLNLPGQSASQRHEAAVPALPIQVRPIPPDWPAHQAWLPALGVQMDAGFSQTTRTLRQGQALELQISLDVVGQQARNLPRFLGGQVPGWQVEPLAEDLRDRIVDGLLVGSLRQRLLLRPLDSGQLSLPELQVPWWDVREHRAQSTRKSLPVFEVLPSGQASPPETSRAPAMTPAMTPLPGQPDRGWLGWLLPLLALPLVWLIWYYRRQLLPPRTSLPPLNP